MVPARPSVPVLRQIAEGSLSKGDWLGSGGLRGKLWDLISYKLGCSDLLILKEHLAALPYSPPRGRSIQKGQASGKLFKTGKTYLWGCYHLQNKITQSRAAQPN